MTIGDHVVVITAAFPGFPITHECEVVGLTDSGESIQVRSVQKFYGFYRKTIWVSQFDIRGIVIARFPDGSPRTDRIKA